MILKSVMNDAPHGFEIAIDKALNCHGCRHQNDTRGFWEYSGDET